MTSPGWSPHRTVFLDGSAPGAEPVSVPADSTVHVRVTPFGVDGPRRDWAATDLTVAALGGMLAQVGYPDGPPLLLPQGQAEQLAGVNAAIAHSSVCAHVGSARYRRSTSPRRSASPRASSGDAAYLHEDRVPPAPGRVHPLVPHGLFRAAAGFLGGGLGGSPRMWDALLAWLVEEGRGRRPHRPPLGRSGGAESVTRNTSSRWCSASSTSGRRKSSRSRHSLASYRVGRRSAGRVARQPQLNDRDFSSTWSRPTA